MDGNKVVMLAIVAWIIVGGISGVFAFTVGIPDYSESSSSNVDTSLDTSVSESNSENTTDNNYSSSSDDYANQKMNEYENMNEEEKEKAFISGSYDDYNPN